MTEQWVIQDEKTGKYFSLLGSPKFAPHFTENIYIANVLSSERDAIMFEEEHIHNELEFLQYDTRPVRLNEITKTTN